MIDFTEIIKQICNGRMKIGGTLFFDEIEFLEAQHQKAEYKGKIFYQNIYYYLLQVKDDPRAAVIKTKLLPYIETKLDKPISDATAIDNIITRQQLMKLLKISEPTVIAWEKKGKLPVLRMGKNIRYNWTEVKLALGSKKK